LGFPPVVYLSSNWANTYTVPTADAVVTGKVSCYYCTVRLRTLPSLWEMIGQG